MAKPLAAIGVLAIVVGGAAIGYAVTRRAAGGMTPAQTTAMTSAVGQLDGEIQKVRSQIAEHASTLSSLLTVRAAIVTDVETVNNLVARGDVAAKGDEILEIGRIDKATKKVDYLLLLPTGAMRKSHEGIYGAYAELVGDQLVLTEVVKVEPTQDGDKYAGFLSVTRPLALGKAIKSLVDAGISGKLVLGSGELAIGAPPAGATMRPQPLGAQPDAKILAAEAPARAMLPLATLVGGIGAAVIGLLLLVISMMGKRDASDATRAFNALPTQPTNPPRASSIGTAQTQLSESGIALGTPSPVDGGGAQIVPSNIGPGAMIGRWEVVRRLGSGGMADVFLAQAKGDGGFEKLVAIKVMHSHLARTQRAVDHFLDEARLAARIHHPNVVAIQDLGKIGHEYVIVMEYVEGVDLERLLMAGRQAERLVPIDVGLGILCRICDGLDAAHHATTPDGEPLAIIHRDVKSANVLVSRQGVVKVVDFGIAKAAKQVHHTVAGETKGTPSMMAPEQRVGEQVDVRADVYSVAAVGFELLTGHGVNLDLAALAHLGVDNWPHLPLPSSLRPGLPPELDEILLHAMAFDRDRRPADCAAFAALCEAVMKRHGLNASDKDIARWAEAELRLLPPSLGGPPISTSKSPSLG